MERNNHLLLEIRELPQTEAIAFIRSYHYSKVLPRLIKYYLGFYADGQLLGGSHVRLGNTALTDHKKDISKGSLFPCGSSAFLCFLNSFCRGF